MTEAQRACVGGVFYLVDLGHFIGLDTHDVGGYLLASRNVPRPGLSKLRTARTLKQGMCLTVEPGCYFIDALLDDALKDPSLSKYLNADVVRGFRGFGGVPLGRCGLYYIERLRELQHVSKDDQRGPGRHGGRHLAAAGRRGAGSQAAVGAGRDGALEDVSVLGDSAPEGRAARVLLAGRVAGYRRGSGLADRPRASERGVLLGAGDR